MLISVEELGVGTRPVGLMRTNRCVVQRSAMAPGTGPLKQGLTMMIGGVALAGGAGLGVGVAAELCRDKNE